MRARAALAGLLDSLLEATGMQRAFVVSAPASDGRPRVELARSRSHDPLGRPSRGAVRRALASPGVTMLADVDAEPGLRERRSVRSLCLRSVCGVSIPACGPGSARYALVADSRRPRPAVRDTRAEDAAPLLSGFARLAGLILARGSHPERDPAGGPHAPDLVGAAAPFRRMLGWIRRVAPYDLPVLITGESGTGKEGVARALHAHSRRSGAPFVALNCAALPETLLESELFGAVRGAYTGSERDRPGLMRQAHGGTLLLDEIGDMPPAMQAKLLRALQSGRLRPVGGDREVETDVRVLAATHRDLRERLKRGLFRNDLYHRIAVVAVHVPALRDRLDDLGALARHLIGRVCDETSLPPAALDVDAMRSLAAHDWPGNVRELRAVLTRALLRATAGTIRTGDLDLPGATGETGSRGSGSLERAMIESALRSSGFNVARAAARIGWSRQKLYRRMELLGVPRSSDGTTSSDSSTFQ